MQLFYHPELDTNTTQVTFSKEESKHIIKVLRKKPGDILDITNGRGKFFKAEITDENSNKCTVQVVSKETKDPLPYTLHMAVAPTKLNDRYEWFLEKATEIGVTEITPIICERSERTKINRERFEKIIHSAAKQSLKAYFPKINQATDLNSFLKQNTTSNVGKYIAHCMETAKDDLSKVVAGQNHLIILIGPEGDFSESEIAQALKQNYTAVSLGNSRLRTETAALVAVHTANLILDHR